MSNSWILHIDGDGFFAYCESARFPELWGKPVVVGVDRGIACAMTYEAKELGITRGMSMYQIKEAFPQVTRLTSHFELYAQYGQKLRAIIEPEVKSFETYSIDECFCEVIFPDTTNAQEIQTWLHKLKSVAQAHIGITYSFGLARTKVLAKVASKLQKPNGCTIITPDQEEGILKETPIETIWGIGRRLHRRIARAGVKTAYDFIAKGASWVEKEFARPTQELWLELTGKRIFRVHHHTALHKSIQSTRSFTGTSIDLSFITAELLHNVDIACTRARRYNLASNAVSIFLKTKDRTYHSDFIPLADFTNNPLLINERIARAIEKIYTPHTKYRSTGVTLYNLRLVSRAQRDLFGAQEEVFEEGKVMETIDTIRKRFGKYSIGTLGVLPAVKIRAVHHAERESLHPYVPGLPYPYLGDVI